MFSFESAVKFVAMSAAAVLVSTSLAAAQQGGKYWVPNAQSATYQTSDARKSETPRATAEKRKRAAYARMHDPAATGTPSAFASKNSPVGLTGFWASALQDQAATAASPAYRR